jgi:hypothetical protein
MCSQVAAGNVKFVLSGKKDDGNLDVLKVSIVLPPILKGNHPSEARILQQAHDLFMQYGIRSVTMDEIAVFGYFKENTLSVLCR